VLKVVTVGGLYKMRDYAEFLTEEQIVAEVTEMAKNPAILKHESEERSVFFTNPANAEEIEEQQSRMDLVIALYEARKTAGLAQK
jgi:hypothetical protein